MKSILPMYQNFSLIWRTSDPQKMSHCMLLPFQQNKCTDMNFKDLLQKAKSTQGSHMSSYSLNSYDILEPGKATCYLSSICSTHRGPSEVPPYWNNLLSRVLNPILLLL